MDDHPSAGQNPDQPPAKQNPDQPPAKQDLDQPLAKQNIEQPAASARPATEVKPSDPKPAQPSTRDDFAKASHEMTGFERSTLRWARVAVLLSALAAAFVCAQWWEMHQGGKDTHGLAVAAGDQATWTQRLAGSAGTQADRTKDLADRMKDQADRTQDLATDSAGQLATMRSQLELANRPWIKVVSVTTRDVPGSLPALSFRQTGPFDPQHSPPATWTSLIVYVTVENMGPSVAINTDVLLIPLTPAVVQHDYGKDILVTETAMCRNQRKARTGINSHQEPDTPRAYSTGAVTMFPNDPFERHATLSFVLNPKLVQHPPGFSNEAGYLALSVGGCITYQSAVSKKVYQTGFIYDLVGFDKGFNDFIGVIPLAANISAKDLRFDRNDSGYFAQ